MRKIFLGAIMIEKAFFFLDLARKLVYIYGGRK